MSVPVTEIPLLRISPGIRTCFHLTAFKLRDTRNDMRRWMPVFVPRFLLLVTSFAAPQQLSSGKVTVSQTEREALLVLYQATDGNHWKNSDGWLGAPGTECEWFGVSCFEPLAGTATVTALNLGENNLKGTIPDQLGQLPNLESLSLFGNQLRGTVPELLIHRWISGSLWLAAEDSILTDVSEIDFESSPSMLLCGRIRITVNVDGSVAYLSKRCRNSNPNDRTTFCEVKRGQVWPRYFAKLAWTLNANGFYGFHREYDRNITEGTFESTRVVKSGKKYEVVNYADAGPFELWVIQRAIESTVTDAEWVSVKQQPDCPRWDKGEIKESATKKQHPATVP
jgi:hypothetical protein